MSDHENYENYENNHEHHNEHHEHHDEHHVDTSDAHVAPSAPTSDENGFIVVPDQLHHVVDNVQDAVKEAHNEITALISNLNAKANEEFSRVVEKAEADSSTGNVQPEVQKTKQTESESCTKSSCGDKSSCSICPYYRLGMKFLHDRSQQIPPKVKDLLLWRNPKKTGAVFGSSLALLISLASFSLLTVISTLMLLSIVAVGSYRFYLAVIYRIKGTSDDTLDKLRECDLALPKEKVQEFSRLLETDINKMLNKIKSIVLWENITTSALAFIGFYFVNCVGCVFNTLTLLILALVSVFTLPKIYEVYQAPIDSFLQKVTNACHQGVKQVMVKLPFLNKKKTQ